MQSSKKNIKKIWILNHHAVTPSTGTGTRHYDFAKELIKRGYEVTIFASSHIHYTDINLLEKGERYKITEEDGIHWVWVNTMPYTSNGARRILGMVQYYFAVLRISKEMAPPDIVIGSAVHLLACAAAYKISKRYRIKCISEIRDLWPETLIQMGRLKRESFLAKMMNRLEDYVYKKSNQIVITAPGMEDYIVSRGISADKITYINNGIDTVLFEQRYETAYKEDEQCKLEPGFFHVAYTGGHGLANDLETAVQAAGILQGKGYGDIRITFFGEGPAKSRLIEMAREMELNNVEFRPYVPKYCVPKILKGADALIVLLKDLELYRFGMSMNKVFEYLYSGTPIVFAVNVPNDYVAETGDGFSIQPENPQEMADAIIRLYHMEKVQRDKMGQQGKAFVKGNFDIPVLVDKLEEVINF